MARANARAQSHVKNTLLPRFDRPTAPAPGTVGHSRHNSTGSAPSTCTDRLRAARGLPSTLPSVSRTAVESCPALRRRLLVRNGRAMPKTRKPNTTRKPPVPSDNHADIEDWLRRVMPDLHPVVKRLDELIRETIPGLQYAIKSKRAYYGLPKLGWIIEMV